MNVDIVITGADSAGENYLTWSPTAMTVRVVDGPGPGTPVSVTLTSAGPGGQLVFGLAPANTTQDTLSLSLPGDGTPVSCQVAGKFGHPSTAAGDAAIQAVAAGSTALLGSKTLMVRIRKNANDLTAAERDRFVAAFGTLNDRGMGPFSDFRNIHLDTTKREAHGNVGFLPWHRAYLLDLERELQGIDPTIALPYWRFDQPAPNLFTREFMGVPDTVGRVQFVAGHPLEHWATDGVTGIIRTPQFAANAAPPTVRTEAQTFALGGAGHIYKGFVRMEGNPHGEAHVSFDGFIDTIDTAAKDPLFFLLHANVDRLWAKWQWFHKRFDSTSAPTYAPSSPTRVGHDLPDTMWPWNGVITPPRPSSAPGGTFPPSALVTAPGLTPTVRAMIDYQGVIGSADRLGFDYDDVPFQP
jgi:tyrosinase